MRFVVLALALAFAAAGCGGDHCGVSADPPDMSAHVPAACPAGAEQASTAKCSYGVDKVCRSSFGYDCHCLCTGYWECDQVLAVCDPDGGAPPD
jgi:hypothetical protein